ncbi:ribonucleotide reductase A subunit [Elephant endotheliotropic herpesvirus 5B]|uniref:Ribonucleotide reductase subunit 1 n=2 Tax=Elephant endotheliotropic herpesvirus 5 TaxID=768738 RepID=A0A075CYG9_9BETA|nr:ribonucleotide reductase subunit 1 [Elephant endotheliotropic herpesvirus 5]AHC02845.1 ribonucleotide reductase subunit 1 [Elephant endotheliotropic herpesvirus 5]UVZ35249.1 ribonucleotide reductase A subunit [Elephant endotheliotropic herpesvirus 5B]
MSLYLQEGNAILQALRETDESIFNNIMKLKRESENDSCVFPKIVTLLKYMQVTQQDKPDIDGVLGALCHLGSEKKACTSIRHYAEHYSPLLSTDVRLALMNLCKHIESRFVRTNTDAFLKLEGRGFMSAMKFINIYFREYDGRIENLLHFFCRITAFFSMSIVRNPAYYGFFKKPDFLSIFGEVFQQLITQTVGLCSPVMLNAGISAMNLTSCFIVVRDLECNADVNDVQTSILRQILDCGGGIGLDVSHFGSGLDISKYFKMLNSTVEFYNEYLRRPVGLSVSMDIWNKNIYKLLRMKMPNASEEESCPSLFNAVMIPDLFFKRYEENSAAKWSLFSGNMAKVLSSSYGKKFESAYTKYEQLGLYDTQVPIKELLFSLLNSIVNTGTPYILFKDAMNRHYYMEDNTSSSYTIRATNLCAEIVHHANDSEVGVCNICSVNLVNFVKCYVPIENQSLQEGIDFVTNDDHTKMFSLKDLRETVQRVVVMVNCSISESGSIPMGARLAAGRYRSMGVGVQGLHTMFLKMKLGFTSETARDLNRRIFENMYYSALNTSMTLCKNGLEPFYNFHKSKYSRGWLHYDGWEDVKLTLPSEWWSKLRAGIGKYGLYNAQFIALMPTSGTSQTSAVSEAFYPNFSNFHSKITTGVEVLVSNKELQREFCMYSSYLSNIDWEVSKASETYFTAPEWEKLMRYRNAFEYDQETLIDMCADRAPFVDHSQSMSLFVREEDITGCRSIYSLLRHAHKKGLKTGMYYLRIRKQARLRDLEKKDVFGVPVCSSSSKAVAKKDSCTEADHTCCST